MVKNSELWREFVYPGTLLCGLCGNRGILDTRGRVSSYGGVPCGVRVPCICPNGRAIKKAEDKAAKAIVT